MRIEVHKMRYLSLFMLLFVFFSFNSIFATSVTNLNIKAENDYELVLAWKIDGDLGNAYPYVIRKKASSNSWEVVASLEQNISTFTDTQLEGNTEYCYKVYLYEGNSPFGHSAKVYAYTKP